MGNVKQDSSENNLPKGHPPQITPQGIPDPRSKSEKNNKPKEKGSYKRGDYIAKVAPTSANDDEKLQIARICEGFRGFSSIATMILQVYLRSTYAQVAVQPKSKSETSKPKPPGGIVYTPDKIQTYAEWSENFVKLMCLYGHEKERSEFNKLSNYRRIRRWLSVLGAYLFAQVAVLSGYHEKVSNSQIKASSPLLKSYGNVKSNLMMMRKTFLQLKRASGLWPRYGQDRADQVQQVLEHFLFYCRP
jgi:hypothetical protein